MPTEPALVLLEDEARRGLLDAELVQVFIASRSYAAASMTNGSARPLGHAPALHRDAAVPF
jgi:hypothetical protein